MGEQQASAYFNPRTPLQSAIKDLDLDAHGFVISIHALHYRVRSPVFVAFHVQLVYFNPRTPLQSAIQALRQQLRRSFISIHALHYRVRFISGT